MTGQRVTPGGLAITAWARSHLRCHKIRRVKVVGHLKRHRSSELSGSAKLTGAVWREAQTGITLGQKATCRSEEKMSAEAEMCGEQDSQTANHTFSRGGV